MILQAESSERRNPDDLNRIFVRGSSGEMVPLKSVVTYKYVTGPDLITRFNNFPAVKITANAAPGYSSGQAMEALKEIGAEVLPADYGIAWSGEAFEEQSSGSSSALVFGFGIVMVFLILAAQYEKWSLPIGVLLAVPFALFGALVAVLWRGLDNNVYFQIGLTMLVALAAKNAILIFEFAVLNRESGTSVYDAAMTAARERLRPIVRHRLPSFLAACRWRSRRVHRRTAVIREQPSFDRHGRNRRDAGRDAHRRVLHSDVFLRAGKHERKSRLEE